MKNLYHLFEDKYNFFHIGTLICILILVATDLLDYFTTIAFSMNGTGKELNIIVSFIMNDPFIFGFIKLIRLGIIILMFKYIHDLIKSNPKIQEVYNDDIHIYIIFSIISGMALSIGLNNLVVLHVL